MARNRKKSDEVWNAKRRLNRAIARATDNMHKATSTTEINKMNLMIAEYKRQLENVGRVAKQLYKGNLDLGEAKQKLAKMSERYKAVGSKKERRERTARNIMSSNIGSRIIGAFEPLWNRDGETRDIQQVIFDALGVETWGDALEKLEAEFPDLYKEPGNEQWYDTVKQEIMLKYA